METISTLGFGLMAGKLATSFSENNTFILSSYVDDAGTIGKTSTTTLYRAMSEAEYTQLMKTGQFSISPNSLGGKFFAESAEDATKWGNILEGAGNFKVVKVELPTDVVNNFMRWYMLDNIGPARYAEINQIKNFFIGPVQ